MTARQDWKQAAFAVDDEHELSNGDGLRVLLPKTPLTALGDLAFRRAHGLKVNYVAGAMANGIASVELVSALARAGMLGIFGAAGLAPVAVAAAVTRLKAELGALPFGVNLIHSPNEPKTEDEVSRLLVREGVRLVEASAYLRLTLPIVRYRVHGIYRDASGAVVAPNRVIAKVSRVEVATPFLSPPPIAMLEQLVALGEISAAQAELAAFVPMAEDVTAEADSGGHTDNRPALALLPTMLALRDRLSADFGYAVRPRIGAAGGISTPASMAAVFAMGAAYAVTGSVNQACIESGSSALVREMLAGAKQADVAMAPAADMFEMGVKVQVLKHGTMFPMRAAKLYELYVKHGSLDDLPATERDALEKHWFRAPLAAVWESTRRYFEARDPEQIARAGRDPRHKMALVFRSYLGQSSHWANAGLIDRKLDFQVWCGPAMGAFNEWAKGSHFERPEGRRVVDVARNLLFGAAVQARLNMLRLQGVPSSELDAVRFQPRPEAGLN